MTILINPTKKQLRHERAILEGLINRYGNIKLLDAHDRVSVELDYFRGDCVRRKRKKNDINNDNIDKEHLTWMA